MSRLPCAYSFARLIKPGTDYATKQRMARPAEIDPNDSPVINGLPLMIAALPQPDATSHQPSIASRSPPPP